MLRFNTLDSFPVFGRGIAHVVLNQVKQTQDELVKSLLGTTVLLNGVERRVLGVETLLISNKIVCVGESFSLVVEDTRTAKDIAYEAKQVELEDALQPRLTDEFLATLSVALDTFGWTTDVVEVKDFVDMCYEIAGKPAPPFNELNPAS